MNPSQTALVLWMAALGSASGASAAEHPLQGAVVIPQLGVFGERSVTDHLTLNRVAATVHVRDGLATTELAIELVGSNREVAVELLLPVSDAVKTATVSRAAAGTAPPALELLDDLHSRERLLALAELSRNAAPLEFADLRLIRSESTVMRAGRTETVTIRYSEPLAENAGRIDYVLPRSESLASQPPWAMQATIAWPRSIAAVYSPTHALETTPASDGSLVVRALGREPGPFRLSWLAASGEVATTVFAHPEGDGGTFLLLATVRRSEAVQPLNRQFTCAIDCSASMGGDKMQQVQGATLKMLSELRDGEAFNVVTYNDSAWGLASEPLPKNAANLDLARRYLENIQTRGGTNLHAGLAESLKQPPAANALPFVLLVTDGVPTVGETSESKLAAAARQSNAWNSRVYTFGVGVDVNSPLLERIAADSRGKATFVLPGENLESKVAAVVRDLDAPVMANVELQALTPEGAPAEGRLFDVVPAVLPDLFQHEPLIALGRYRGDEPLVLSMTGKLAGGERSFRAVLDPAAAAREYGFVPRMWASRRIGQLLETVRRRGASQPAYHTADADRADPEVARLSEEIVRLSARYGVVTEYTSHLAAESGLRPDDGVEKVLEKLDRRVVRSRVGSEAVNQSLNLSRLTQQAQVEYGNSFYNPQLEPVSISSVQPLGDRAYFRRQEGWIDGALLERGGRAEPQRVVSFATPEHRRLLDELCRSGRQAAAALPGDVLLVHEGRAILVKNPPDR
ncbi:MAG: VWA domain-containing protein [Planctomycetes bacterium]|nr:VWA domain-containing protein [Planctomycetota bacterium]